MAFQIQGNGGVVADVDGTAFRALKTTVRPTDHGALGQYRFSTQISLVALQASSGNLLSFRWTDATRFCVINFIRLECLQTAAATATIWPSYRVLVTRTYTTADTTNTAAVTLTGNNMKKRTSMGTTLVSSILKSNANSAGMTGATRTNDTDAVMELMTQQTITTTNQISYTKALDFTTGGEHPIVLAQNEGIVVVGPTTVFGAAGTATLIVDMAWAEVTAY